MSQATNTSSAILAYPARLWTRLTRYLNARADRHVAAWSSSLQYKRRYTNPDVAKRYRSG